LRTKTLAGQSPRQWHPALFDLVRISGMVSDASVQRFSTVADFDLFINGRSYKVAQVAPGFLLLDKGTAIPPGPGVLVIRVEGQEIRRTIELPVGASEETDRIEIRRLDG
jgi:hypothetical protein